MFKTNRAMNHFFSPLFAAFHNATPFHGSVQSTTSKINIFSIRGYCTIKRKSPQRIWWFSTDSVWVESIYPAPTYGLYGMSIATIGPEPGSFLPAWVLGAMVLVFAGISNSCVRTASGGDIYIPHILAEPLQDHSAEDILADI